MPALRRSRMGSRPRFSRHDGPARGAKRDTMGPYGKQRDVSPALTIWTSARGTNPVDRRAIPAGVWISGLRAVNGAQDTCTESGAWGVRATHRRCPQQNEERGDRTACKPGSVQGLATRGRPFLWDGPCGPPRATNPDGARRRACQFPGAHPYSVLLQAGLAVPSLSPGTRWALTPPFHPYPGTSPGAVCFLWRYPSARHLEDDQPGGRYPPPCLRGARTFLQHCCQRSPGRPIEPAIYHPAGKRAILPFTEAKSPHGSKYCAWSWPVQVGPTKSAG